MRIWLAAPVVAALTACVAVEPPVEPPVQPAPDLCNAAQYQVLVGQSRAVLGGMMLPAGTRIIGPDDAVTADFNPRRANVEIGASGRIEKVGCY